MPPRLRALAGEGMRFGLVGIGATLTYLVISLAAQWLWGRPLLSSSLGYVASVGVSYFGHAGFTFRTARPHLTTGPRFLGMSLAIFGLTNLIVLVVTGPLGQPFIIAAATVVLAIPLFTWVLSRLWVFGPSA
jgi:putative flippase GtrA